MHQYYEGIKFYSENDISISYALEEAETIIKTFNAEIPILDVNKLIELYNVKKLIDSGVRLKKWSAEEYALYQTKVNAIAGFIVNNFPRINDTTFSETYQNVSITYLEDFWELFVMNSCYKSVSPTTFMKFLLSDDASLYILLRNKKLVQKYDEQFAQALRTSDQSCQILVTQFLEKSDVKYFLPSKLDKSEYETIFQKYIASENPNPNILKLIFDAQSTKECPIKDKIKLNAKRRFEEYWKAPYRNATTIQHGISISFIDQDEVVKHEREGTNFKFSYDIKWLEENLDYSTILNNFIYVFEMFDFCFRSNLVSVKTNISAIEEVFRTNGVKFYVRGNVFNHFDMLSSGQMSMYFQLLKKHAVDIEDVFQWFFETYLPEEFGITGFIIKPSTATDYAEKCRNLACEMDGILKQFRMYVEDGKIDRELFEMSTESLRIDGIPSLMQDKYAYSNSVSLKNEMFLLFSDQSTIHYTEKTKSKYSSFFELLYHEKMYECDFLDYQISTLHWLIDRGCIIRNSDGLIALYPQRISILKDLYRHDVLCLQYWNESSDIIQEMKANGDIRIENTLFSEPERDYLNYMLNKAEYSDGLNLRNKYAHSSYQHDVKVQYQDYIELLKVMVLVVTKMNEEFCWIDDRKRGIET